MGPVATAATILRVAARTRLWRRLYSPLLASASPLRSQSVFTVKLYSRDKHTLGYNKQKLSFAKGWELLVPT